MTLNYTELHETFEKAYSLLVHESKKDPVSEPYKSKYVAKKIFVAMKSGLKKLQDDERESDEQRICYMAAVLDYYIGIISVDTDEWSTGEEHLCTCLESLKDQELLPENIILVINALNQLGILCSNRDQLVKSKEYLERAEELYKKYTLECKDPPYWMSDLFKEHVESNQLQCNFQKLESALTYTLYYLAQVYSSLNDTDRAGIYCHATLKRQLESKEFDPVDWALNCASLSQFFTSQCAFKAARHHLAYAIDVLDHYELELASTAMDEATENKWGAFKNCKADVACCWAKYSQALLTSSKAKLMAMDDEVVEEVEKCSIGEAATDTNKISKENRQPTGKYLNLDDDTMFQSLEVTAIEEQVTADYVEVYADARKVFLNAQKWLNVAKEYYLLETHASCYIKIVQDMSMLYKSLIFFESHSDRQCKMHKRRADLLESVLKEINPKYYLNECQQIQFELGQIYSDIMDIKSAMLRDGETEHSAHAIQKINHLSKQSIHYFSMFIETFQGPDGEKPEKFSLEIVRPVLMAHFFIARLYSKLMSSEKEKQLEWLNKSVDGYQYVANYCESNEDCCDIMKEELSVSKEMIRLLPLKMEKILSYIP